MPLWIVYHPPASFSTNQEKGALAKAITEIYFSIGMPKFYANVQFIQSPVNTMWIGGETRHEKPFIRLTVDHIAARLDDDDKLRLNIMDSIVKKIEPFFKDYDWEIHIDETDRRLWRINGLVPPPRLSAGEALWAKANVPVPHK